MFLNKELTELELLIDNHDQLNTNVSAKGIDWHLDHSLKVIFGVCSQLKKSDPSAYQWKFNVIRVFVYTFNFFPRGKGKSPKSVLPPDNILKENIENQLNLARKELVTIINLPDKSYFKHPYFGFLNLKRTKKFLKLHTLHHLKICREIVK